VDDVDWGIHPHRDLAEVEEFIVLSLPPLICVSILGVFPKPKETVSYDEGWRLDRSPAIHSQSNSRCIRLGYRGLHSYDGVFEAAPEDVDQSLNILARLHGVPALLLRRLLLGQTILRRVVPPMYILKEVESLAVDGLFGARLQGYPSLLPS